jgi:hypothetical protein
MVEDYSRNGKRGSYAPVHIKTKQAEIVLVEKFTLLGEK